MKSYTTDVRRGFSEFHRKLGELILFISSDRSAVKRWSDAPRQHNDIYRTYIPVSAAEQLRQNEFLNKKAATK